MGVGLCASADCMVLRAACIEFSLEIGEQLLPFSTLFEYF